MEHSTAPSVLGHVIRIIDKYTVIVDVGNSILSLGDTVQIYSLGEPLIGLDGKEICKYVNVKETLAVVDVQDYYSICQKSKMVPLAPHYEIPLSPMLERSITEREALTVNEAEIQHIQPADNHVHVGDFVKFA